MKIVLAQLNYHIGNFELNADKMIKSIEQAKEDGADLVVFSELAVCGYPPYDFLERKEFIQNCTDTIEQIAKMCNGIAAIVGGPEINPEPQGKNLFNAAYFLEDGQVKQVVRKTLLPNYDVFDEYRYFQPNIVFDLIKFNGKKIALTICEDIWDDQPVANAFARDKLYTLSPMDKLIQQKPDFAINIAASPFSYTQVDIRRDIVRNKARQYKIPFIYVNQVGANTELIFDGNSMVVNGRGDITHQAKAFEEDTVHIDMDALSDKPAISPKVTKPIQLIYDALVAGVRDYFAKMGFKSATLGLSGGIDSAVTVAIAAEALGKENVHVLLLPSQYSSDHSIKDAVDLANNLGIQYDIVPIKEIFNSYNFLMSPIFAGKEADVTEENIQARIRGTLLMALSNKFGHILLNTSNKSEAAVGYGTLYGDMNGGLSVLGDVYKTDVFKLARYINRDVEIIPENTIVKPPSAELRPDQKDSDSLPDYDVLDAILFRYIEKNQSPAEIVNDGFEEATVKKAIRLVNMNEYKRFQTPPTLRISSKAFGIGRRIPLVAKH
ncbi:NAD+ synthase [Carboxylicivirga sediminis]|uniref:Glutamine-dependent NAD(+) synthetase n=1 Tax=Carboxylicivirga sediminis TaxID=2006564 RepID=A0A941F3N6_9BACT|nr:NAD+ synthase [Carboxylicivirga sediminis]MBR8536208.1 NAD+ synthase [Carboxylicivirga sediminis]